MHILHLTGHSLVRFTPARTSYYWEKYFPGEHSGAAICLGRGGGGPKYTEELNPFGLYCTKGEKELLISMATKADVIHCHDDCYPTQLPPTGKKQPRVYHAHIGDIPTRFFARRVFRYDRGVRHACITNGYGHLFDVEEKRSGIKWGRLPDVLDINHPLLSPKPELRPEGKFRVVFTFSNNYGLGHRINSKCPRETRDLLRGVAGLDLRFVSNVPFALSMEEKQSAHVVLDELFSPYTHLSSLEGAAVGAAVLVNYDDYTRNDLCDYLGAPRESYPFVRVTPQTVRAELERLRDHPDECAELGRKGREWIERWYQPKALLERYLEFYRS